MPALYYHSMIDQGAQEGLQGSKQMGTGQVPGQSQHILWGSKKQELPRLQEVASRACAGGWGG